MPTATRKRPAKRPNPTIRFNDLLHGVVAWEWDADRDRIITSGTLRRVYGVDRIERLSKGFSLVHPDDYEKHQTRVHLAVDRCRGYRSTFRIVRPDTKRIAWIDERAEAIAVGSSDPPLLIGIAFDATLRQSKQATRSATRAYEALDAFVDALLTRYARDLRRDPAAARLAARGDWIAAAEKRIARRKRARSTRSVRRS
jgi:PAS domain-containing protein